MPKILPMFLENKILFHLHLVLLNSFSVFYGSHYSYEMCQIQTIENLKGCTTHTYIYVTQVTQVTYCDQFPSGITQHL